MPEEIIEAAPNPVPPELDVIGTLYDQPEDPETAPTPLPGYHVNSPYKVSGWTEVFPETPRRVFAGVPTFFYSFEDEATFLAAVEAGVTPVVTPKVPASVTRRQAKQALAMAGLLANVQPAIDAIPDATQRQFVQIEWDDSQVFERNRPALIGLGMALGLDSDDLDALFIAAGSLP